MLERIITYLHTHLGVFPCVGVELEFYVKCSDASLYPLLREITQGQLSKQLDIQAESCDGQYELRMGPTADISGLLVNLTHAKAQISNIAAAFDGALDFSAKPYLDSAGNAFHVHVNLMNQVGSNVFCTGRSGGTEMSAALLHSLGGLCACMKEHMLFFAPNVQSYLRYNHNDIHTPTTVSWGGNNRSTALRIPDTTLEPEKCRIEHRVSGADCDYASAVAAILFGIAQGIERKLLPPEKTFGVASNTQYNLERLPRSLQEATALHVPIRL